MACVPRGPFLLTVGSGRVERGKCPWATIRTSPISSFLGKRLNTESSRTRSGVRNEKFKAPRMRGADGRMGTGGGECTGTGAGGSGVARTTECVEASRDAAGQRRGRLLGREGDRPVSLAGRPEQSRDARLDRKRESIHAVGAGRAARPRHD